MSLQILIFSGCRLCPKTKFWTCSSAKPEFSSVYNKYIYLFWRKKMRVVYIRGHIASHSFGGWWNFRNRKTCSTEKIVYEFLHRAYFVHKSKYFGRHSMKELRHLLCKVFQFFQPYSRSSSVEVYESLRLQRNTKKKNRYLNVGFFVLRVRFRFFHVSLDTIWMGWKCCDRSHWKSDSRRAHEYWRVAKNELFGCLLHSFLWKLREKSIECRCKKLCKKF